MTKHHTAFVLHNAFFLPFVQSVCSFGCLRLQQCWQPTENSAGTVFLEPWITAQLVGHDLIYAVGQPGNVGSTCIVPNRNAACYIIQPEILENPCIHRRQRFAKNRSILFLRRNTTRQKAFRVSRSRYRLSSNVHGIIGGPLRKGMILSL